MCTVVWHAGSRNRLLVLLVAVVRLRADVCRHDVDGPCSQCVNQSDSWCATSEWDTNCKSVCCGPTQYADNGCLSACASSSRCGLCSDLQDGWTDSDSESCLDYAKNQYCTTSRGYGDGWNSDWGTFDLFATNGKSAIDACCACGGGTSPYQSLDSCGEKGGDESPWSQMASSAVFRRGGPESRIVNGQAATECEWKWQVAVVSQGGFTFCGGALISPRWVLTAAHCVEDDEWNPKVILGRHTMSRWTSAGDDLEVTVEIAQIIMHPDYDTVTVDKDFALLELAQEVPLTSCIGLVCVPGEDVTPGTECMITGWGHLVTEGYHPDVLQEAMVSVTSDADCSRVGASPEWNICAQGSSSAGITDACQGDSGGPLVCQRTDGRWSLHGVTSWGGDCADPNHPGVWARVTWARDWIIGYVSDAVYLDTPSPTPAPPLCLSDPSGWKDNGNYDCAKYAESNWCTASGEFGSDWMPAWGAFSVYAVGGVSAEQACCECGGGQVCYTSPSGWVDSDGSSCADYAEQSWCTPSGGKGSEWTHGEFSWYAVDGVSALEACCECGGGQEEQDATTTTPLPTPAPTPPPQTPAPTSAEKCSQQVEGPCKQCVEARDQWCASHTWDADCLAVCCGPTLHVADGCQEACQGTQSCEPISTQIPSPTPTPPPAVLAQCFVGTPASAGAQCHHIQKLGGRTAYAMQLNGASPSEWTFEFRANFKWLENSSTCRAISVGREKLLSGRRLWEGRCRPTTGWHDWTVVATKNQVRLFCDGESHPAPLVQLFLEDGFVVDAGCPFVVGGRTNHDCSVILSKAKLDASDMKLYSGGSAARFANTALPATTLLMQAKAESSLLACLVPGLPRSETCRSRKEGRANFLQMSLDVESISEWKLMFEADIKAMHENAFLVGFGPGDKRLMSGKNLENSPVCGLNSGWHSWTVAAQRDLLFLYCDGEKLAEKSMAGGFVVPTECPPLIGASFTSTCDEIFAKAIIDVRNAMFFDEGGRRMLVLP